MAIQVIVCRIYAPESKHTTICPFVCSISQQDFTKRGTTQIAMSSTTAPISLKDLTIENITSNVHAINSTCPDPRLKFILERVVVHLHDLARETRLSTAEWMKALLFLTEVGQISSDVRQVGDPSRIDKRVQNIEIWR
jgi:hypothetical protein